MVVVTTVITPILLKLVFKDKDDIHDGNMSKHFDKHIQYEIMKCEDTLIDHLKEVQELANKRYNQLMEEFEKRENITEELKQKDQMKWVGLMNNISNCVDEIVLEECIYND